MAMLLREGWPIGLKKSTKPVTEGTYWGTVWWGGGGGVSEISFVFKENSFVFKQKVAIFGIFC